MKSKLVIIICIGIIILLLYMARSTRINTDDVEKIDKRSAYSRSSPFHMNHQPNHLFWFVQISDIHLNYFHDELRIRDFRTFANEAINAIKPPVVIASGDLTDGKGRDFFSSKQNDEEWKTYREILDSANVQNKTKWLDLRGNHDNFNVPPSMSNNSHFIRYSIQGAKHKRSYMELVKDSSGDLYAFIAVDACLEPGPKRSHNFIGMLTQNDTDHIQHLVDEARKAGANYTIWFGHYPTTCIVTRNKENYSLRNLIAEYDTSLVYLCGHLHTLGGLVTRMYALQKDRFLELELADFKTGRMFRVAAIDHGLFSFVDVKHGVWPIVLITNPKHSLFQLPHRKEAKIQLESTHIRILAFSPGGIKSCTVKIGNEFNEHCKQVNEHLFIVPWKPHLYRAGLHYITVTVTDSFDRVNEVNQPFNLDGKQWLNFDTLGRFFLNTDATILFKSVFWTTLFLCVTPLIFLRIWHELVIAGLLKRRRHNCRSSMSMFQQYWILSSVDRIFWPMVLYCIYLGCGPWVWCEIIDGIYGMVFVWGVYFRGTHLPGAITYVYGFAQLFLCQFPLIWVYSKCIAKRYYQVIGMPTKNHRGWLLLPKQMPRAIFLFIITIEILVSIFFGVQYGTMAFFLAIFRTWSVVLNISLYYLAINVPDNALRPAIFAWSGTDRTPTEDQPTETRAT